MEEVRGDDRTKRAMRTLDAEQDLMAAETRANWQRNPKGLQFGPGWKHHCVGVERFLFWGISVLAYRMSELQDEVASRDERLSAAQAAYSKLAQDFAFNRELISERDEELQQFESSVARLQRRVRDAEWEASEAHSRQAEADEARSLEAAQHTELRGT